MVIRELGLLRFRNYGELFIRFADRLNVFVGRNGQGKTNLLEALHLTTHLESFRTRKISSLIQAGSADSAVQAVVSELKRDKMVRIELSPRGRKVWLDEIIINRISSYISDCFSLLFNPDSLFRFRQSGSERRALFDRLFSFVDPGFLSDLKDMRVVLANRNRLLKSGQRSSISEWNQLFCSKGYAIVTKRSRMTAALNLALSGTFEQLTGRAEEVRLAYRPSVEGEFEFWAKKLGEVEARERQVGHTLVGPQRDDFGFRLDGRDAETLSQGEYRVVYIALLLAVNAWLGSVRGYCPVLILDDLLSELDSTVQGKLLDCLAGLPNQMFISTTYWTEGLCPAPAAVRTIEGGRIL
jgi:DNA replication and repair protein RecF